MTKRIAAIPPETLCLYIYNPGTDTDIPCNILQTLCNSKTDWSTKTRIVSTLCRLNTQISPATIINLFRRWLDATKNDYQLLKECMILTITFGKFYLLDALFEDIISWTVSSPSLEEFAFRFNLAINRECGQFAQNLVTSIINWIEEGIASEEIENNRRISWILQSQSAAQKVIAACLVQGKSNVIDAMASCNNGVSLRLWACFTGDMQQQRARINLILRSNHEGAINTILKHLASWTFEEQNSSEQSQRLQLILLSKCEPAITEIVRYIAKRASETTPDEITIALILNSKCQKLIEAILPYIDIVKWVREATPSELTNRITLALSSKCQKLIDAILPYIYIVKWVCEAAPRERTNRIALIVGSEYQELIGAVLPNIDIVYIVNWVSEAAPREQRNNKIPLILRLKHQKLIEAVLPYINIADLVFGAAPSEQIDRMKLILSSRCQKLIEAILPYIVDWVFYDEEQSEQINRAALILNSGYQELIDAISPYNRVFGTVHEQDPFCCFAGSKEIAVMPQAASQNFCVLSPRIFGSWPNSPSHPPLCVSPVESAAPPNDGEATSGDAQSVAIDCFLQGQTYMSTPTV